MKRKYMRTGVLSLAATAIYTAAAGFPAGDRVAALELLSDGFAVPGLVCVLLFGMLWVLRAGALDGLGYLLKTAASVLLPGSRSPESYGSYRQRKLCKSSQSGRHLLLIGAGNLAVSAVLLAFI